MDGVRRTGVILRMIAMFSTSTGLKTSKELRTSDGKSIS